CRTCQASLRLRCSFRRIEIPAPAFSVIETGDLLGLETGVEARAAEFAADAGHLVAAPGHLRECRLRAVYPANAGPQPRGDAFAAVEVVGHDRRCKTVFAVVREIERFLFRVERVD